MEIVLVDTSAWIEFSRRTGSDVHLELRALIESEAPLASTEPISMELLAGARTDRIRRQIRKLLARFNHVPFDSTVDFPEAARIYRECRVAGVTPRNQVDCMIAAVAMRADASVLAFDSDFERISAITGMRLHTS